MIKNNERLSLKNMLFLKVILVLSSILFSFFIFPKSYDVNTINKELNKLLSNVEFNGAVLIAKDGKIIFKKALGFADVKQTKGLNTNSSFNLASVSKQFTATGIMILLERGKLKLNDSVAKYLPQFSYVKEISIRHLLNHTSGLPDIYRLLGLHWNSSKIAGNEVLLKLFSEHKPELLFKPGEKMKYSNTGYIVLASLIEVVSGQTFSEFVDENIFKPLKMKDTFAYYRTMSTYPRSKRVFGVRRQNNKIVLNDLIFCDGMRGDGNIYSSIEDLYKWDRSLYTERVLKNKTIKMMFTPGCLNNGKSIKYGFGWWISKKAKSVYHGGKWVGFRSYIIRYTVRQDTIIILINYINQKSRDIVMRIKNILELH